MIAKLRRLSLKSKLALFILLFFCIPFLIISINWQQRSNEAIERIAVDYDKLLVDQIQSRLDAYFRDLEKELAPYLVHALIKEFIYLPPDDTYGIFHIGNQLQSEMFPAILHARREVSAFSLISSHGAAVSSEGGFNAAERYRSIIKELSGKQSFKVLHVSKAAGTPVVTAAQRIADRSFIGTQGVFVVDINMDELTLFFGRMQLGESGYIWIFGGDGQVIYHPERSRIGQPLDPKAHERFIGNNGYYMDSSQGVKKLVYYQRSGLTDWYVVSEVPFHELNGGLIELRDASVGFMLLLVLLALLAGGGASLAVTSPLLKLQRLMKRAESGDLTVVAPRNSLYIEIDSLNQGFNRMIAELRRLIEVEHRAELQKKESQIMQKESMLRMMQSQINPHFLYNTLEVINSYAIVAKARSISRMATALARIFRYSLNHATGRVSLRQELDHIRTYLSIHCERNLAFNLHWDVEERNLSRVKTVCMILQPLVENAFQHGYDHYKKSPNDLAIIGREVEEVYLLSIEDRGGGMEPEVMERYNRAFEANDMHDEAEEGAAFGGIGLLNVHQRLYLLFGPGYGLRIARSDRSGTRIDIRLPLEKGERP